MNPHLAAWRAAAAWRDAVEWRAAADSRFGVNGFQWLILHPTIDTRNKNSCFTYFGEQGSPHINKNGCKRGRHGSPWAHTLSARSYGLYGAVRSLFRQISTHFQSIFDENQRFSGYPGLGGRKSRKKTKNP